MESTNPQLISVIMPSHNASKYVEEAIASVLGQSYPHTEIIVVDDGSSDDTPAIVKQLANQHPGRIKPFVQSQSGPYPARNRGLREASGAFVAFLDADDWWRNDCLEILLTALQEKQADLTYCGWQNVGEQAYNIEPFIPPAYEEQDTVATFLRSCPWPIHAALVRRPVMDAVQGFSERCFSSMDYDLWLRILGYTRNMVRVPEVMAYYRWHGSGQISATKWRQVLDAIQVRRDFVSRYPDLVDHLSSDELNELVDGQLLQEAYRAYWNRDLENAQKLFRAALKRGTWQGKDLKYLLPALVPFRAFQRLIGLADKAQGSV
jgi:glycosyltransferase involved in cell wall biosynthesis